MAKEVSYIKMCTHCGNASLERLDIEDIYGFYRPFVCEECKKTSRLSAKGVADDNPTLPTTAWVGYGPLMMHFTFQPLIEGDSVSIKGGVQATWREFIVCVDFDMELESSRQRLPQIKETAIRELKEEITEYVFGDCEKEKRRNDSNNI